MEAVRLKIRYCVRNKIRKENRLHKKISYNSYVTTYDSIQETIDEITLRFFNLKTNLC
jgi:hypothetical protein